MTSNSNIDELLERLLAEEVETNEQEARYLSEAKQAIQQLLDEAYKKGYIDGGISEITK